MVLVFVVDVTLEHCFLTHSTPLGSTVAFLMTRFVRGMVMPKMVASLVVRLSVHASVGADVD